MYGRQDGTPAELSLTGLHITRIEGRCGQYVDSLRITTSDQKVHTYGGSGGSHDYCYDLPASTSFAGLWGRCGSRIDSLGVLCGPASAAGSPPVLKSGPSGPGGGTPFDGQIPEGATITLVEVWHGTVIDSLRVHYKTRDGTEAAMPRWGSSSGARRDELKVRVEKGEYLVGFRGFSRDDFRLARLQLVTNQQESILYGNADPKALVQLEYVRARNWLIDVSHELVGFCGGSGDRVDRLGAYHRRRP
jgi:hypothetical protein